MGTNCCCPLHSSGTAAATTAKPTCPTSLQNGKPHPKAISWCEVSPSRDGFGVGSPQPCCCHLPLLGSFPELFSVPQLSVEGPRNAPEGSALTLLCSTHGNALRPHLSLQYFFYRDGLMVVGPQSAPQHRVPELLLSHSGSYSCQVQMGSVLKRSAPITITVRSEQAEGQGGDTGGPPGLHGSSHPNPGSSHPPLFPPSAPTFPICSQVFAFAFSSPFASCSPLQGFPLHPTSPTISLSCIPPGPLHPSLHPCCFPTRGSPRPATPPSHPHSPSAEWLLWFPSRSGGRAQSGGRKGER